jgi:hypothetical protein
MIRYILTMMLLCFCMLLCIISLFFTFLGKLFALPVVLIFGDDQDELPRPPFMPSDYARFQRDERDKPTAKSRE